MNAKCNGVKALMTSRPNLSILGLIIPLRIHIGRRMNAECNGHNERSTQTAKHSKDDSSLGTKRDTKFHLFLSHSGPFSRHFEMLHGPQRPILGSKQAKNTFLSLPNGA